MPCKKSHFREIPVLLESTETFHLALAHVANRDVRDLNQSEYRRLVIGTHLLRDPVVILLDEPTWDLDPLHTYMVVSILSNHAKKYNRIVMLSTEKPRSDIFPFLDRVTYLCLGDIVYTGATRMMLDYFRNLGFLSRIGKPSYVLFVSGDGGPSIAATLPRVQQPDRGSGR